MKVNTTKENLLHGLQVVQRAVSLKNPMPVLTGVLLETNGTTMKITATDLEIGIECNILVATIEEGTTVVPARYMTEIVRKLPDVPIDLCLNDVNKTMEIKYGSSEAKLHVFDAAEFPAFPSVDKEISLKLSVATLKETLKQVLFAVSTDENRPIFTGVLLEITDNILTLVATDTHRLAMKKIKLTDIVPDAKVIIPGRTLTELIRILNNNEEVVEITIGGNQALFTTEDVSFISRLIEGQYPSYQQVIPQGFRSRFRLKVKELLTATERAALLTRTGNQIIKLNVDQDILFINVNTEIGEIHEEIKGFLDGDPMQIAFNADYLADVLRSVNKEEIYFELNGPLSPGVVKTVDSEDYLSLILPVRSI